MSNDNALFEDDFDMEFEDDLDTALANVFEEAAPPALEDVNLDAPMKDLEEPTFEPAVYIESEEGGAR
eukprot:CAMPEP_0197255320 /NCGR_PEP_ID=MMETSP1429-20130617/71717_1 /TAXON_ID=49237 /ORGANISM="Chaetoceros  sp., Strain UNC1202" /LENGTH=67 /DNA_ID=CAMNT_0042718587 /DNA_START=73 /DNA_END=272 /DNA_ORIENTATION=-